MKPVILFAIFLLGSTIASAQTNERGCFVDMKRQINRLQDYTYCNGGALWSCAPLGEVSGFGSSENVFSTAYLTALRNHFREIRPLLKEKLVKDFAAELLIHLRTTAASEIAEFTYETLSSSWAEEMVPIIFNNLVSEAAMDAGSLHRAILRAVAGRNLPGAVQARLEKHLITAISTPGRTIAPIGLSKLTAGVVDVLTGPVGAVATAVLIDGVVPLGCAARTDKFIPINDECRPIEDIKDLKVRQFLLSVNEENIREFSQYQAACDYIEKLYASVFHKISPIGLTCNSANEMTIKVRASNGEYYSNVVTLQNDKIKSVKITSQNIRGQNLFEVGTLAYNDNETFSQFRGVGPRPLLNRHNRTDEKDREVGEMFRASLPLYATNFIDCCNRNREAPHCKQYHRSGPVRGRSSNTQQ